MRYALVLAALGFAALPAAAQSKQMSANQQRAEAFYEEGWSDLAAESYENAVKEFGEAIGLDAKFRLAYYGLGRAQMGLKRFPEAIKAYETARDLYNSQTAENFANTFEADRLRQDDQAALQTAITQLGKKGTNTANSAQMLSLKSAYQRTQTKRDTQRDVSIGSAVPAFLSVALGSAYFRSARLPDAETAYKAAVASDPKSGEAWSNLAVVYYETSRFDDAEHAVAAAEKAGFHVHPGLKDDIKKAQKAAGR